MHFAWLRRSAIAVDGGESIAVFVNLLMAHEIAEASPLVVGINFAAPETHPISVRDYDLHMRMFGELAAYYPDVKRSLHAGEMLDAQAAALDAEWHIRLALAPAEAGGAAAHRLGHAIALNADPQPDELLAQMRRGGIAIESRPESNRQILGVDPLGHPLVDYLAAGVPVVAFAINSIAYSFLPDADRRLLLRRLEGDFADFEATMWEATSSGGAR